MKKSIIAVLTGLTVLSSTINAKEASLVATTLTYNKSVHNITITRSELISGLKASMVASSAMPQTDAMPKIDITETDHAYLVAMQCGSEIAANLCEAEKPMIKKTQRIRGEINSDLSHKEVIQKLHEAFVRVKSRHRFQSEHSALRDVFELPLDDKSTRLNIKAKPSDQGSNVNYVFLYDFYVSGDGDNTYSKGVIEAAKARIEKAIKS